MKRISRISLDKSPASPVRVLPLRSGLAPLELVLNLPIMLFVMALMILIGTGGAWKTRTNAVARQANWRSFEGRLGGQDPVPEGWPSGAVMTREASSPAIFRQDPWVNHRVVRGPMIHSPAGTSLPVRPDILDLAGGMHQGRAELERPFPVFPSLPPHQYSFRRIDVALDGSRWQYHSMGLSENLTRRVLWTYNVDYQLQFSDPTERFIEAALRVLETFDDPRMKPLIGGDPEVARMGFGQSPDFRPTIQTGQKRASLPALQGRRLRPTLCEGDPGKLYRDEVIPIRRSISEVPERMTDYYIGVYQARVGVLRNRQNPEPGDNDEISRLQELIRQLQRFRQSLARS